ncbi:hypothetical protein LJB88_00885 [Erysipelotrichaceae bacterium OttesenSCG-928-M19]|nr:hypothetical protein [Erysipelotrichaceae bacterium OttesenSCG-928-M19]
MKKSLLALLLAVFLVTGCGGAADDGVDRLSKTDYMNQMVEKAEDMTALSSEMTTAQSSSDIDKYIDDANAIIDEMIDLNGPKDHEDKEKSVDDALTKVKEILESLKGIKEGDTSALTDFYTSYAEVIPELTEALTAYEK